MKLIVCIFTAFILNINISEVRKLYPESADSKINAKRFLDKFEDVNENSDAVLLCYKGAAVVMQAKFEKTIKDKKASIKKGAPIIDKAVAMAPKNIELRMIRLSIQESLPKFIGYSNDISDDRDFILASISTTPKELQTYILDFVMASKSFTEVQKQNAKK